MNILIYKTRNVGFSHPLNPNGQIIGREFTMPLTETGKKILASMKKQYGAKKGKRVFYASINAGKIKGAHK